MGGQSEASEVLALQALAWLVGNEDLLPVFLSSSGASAGDLALQADDPALLASVLDFLLGDDAWIRAFCDETGRRYTEPLEARAWLPGGQQAHWT